MILIKKLIKILFLLLLLGVLAYGICFQALLLLPLLLGGLVYGICLGLLVYAETHIPSIEQPSQAILVLGSKVRSDGTLVPHLEARMEAALSAYLDKPRPVVCCGGKGEDEPAPEGKVMRRWLVERGVPEDHVLAECASCNTTQNLKYGTAMLPASTQCITIITSDFHLPRAMQIARDLGFTVDGIGSPYNPAYWMRNHNRELLAWGKYVLRKTVLPNL